MLKPFKNIKEWLLPIFDPNAYVQQLMAQEGTLGTPLEADASALLERLKWQLLQRLKVMDPGNKTTRLKGQGLDFANLREYVPGDDIRKIDWNVFARTLKPHIREYHDEKQMTVWIAVDLSPSMQFGHRKLKAEMAIELAGILGTFAIDTGFKVGAMIFDGRHREIIRPKAHMTHLRRIFQVALEQQEKAERQLFTELKRKNSYDPREASSILLEHTRELAHLVQKSSFVFFISDFLSEAKGWESPLGKLARHSLLSNIVIQDPREINWPEGIGVVDVFDPEMADVIAMDCDDSYLAEEYALWFKQHTEQLIEKLSFSGEVYVTDTSVPPESAIIQLFQGAGSQKATSGGRV